MSTQALQVEFNRYVVIVRRIDCQRNRRRIDFPRVELKFYLLSIRRQSRESVDRLGVCQAGIRFRHNFFFILEDFNFDRIWRWREAHITDVQKKSELHRLIIEVFYRVLRAVVGHPAGLSNDLEEGSFQPDFRGTTSLVKLRNEVGICSKELRCEPSLPCSKKVGVANGS